MTPSPKTPGPLLTRAPLLALALPLLVLVALAAYGLWFRLSDPLAEARGLVVSWGLAEPSMIPAGTGSRSGPGPHPAVGLGFSPELLDPSSEPEAARPGASALVPGETP